MNRGKSMRFWTAYQEPLRQAVKIDAGKALQAIPDHPPKTPARWVTCVGEHKGDLVVGRKASVERYKIDGSEFIDSIYHPWIWGLHVVGSYNGHILIASSGIDVCFLMDENGNMKWSWWAWKDGYGPEPVMVKEERWQSVQLTSPDQGTTKDSPHLNSANPDEGGIIVTLLRPKKVLFLDTNVSDPKSKEVTDFTNNNLHDFKYDRRGSTPILVGGVTEGVFIGGKIHRLHPEAQDVKKLYKWGFVKRVSLYEDDKYLVTYETGVAVMDRAGRVLSNIALPRPFNTVLF